MEWDESVERKRDEKFIQSFSRKSLTEDDTWET
jgi:hypothetical protein